MLISGNIPFDTEVASVYIFGQIESDNVTGAAAVSVVLLAISFAALLGDRRRSERLGDEARWLGTAAPLRRDRLPERAAARCRSRSCFRRTFADGFGPAWDAVTTPAALHAFWLTILIAADRRAG